jgi:hypothetical protein
MAHLFQSSGVSIIRRPAMAFLHSGRHSIGREFPPSLLPETGMPSRNGVMGSNGFTWRYNGLTGNCRAPRISIETHFG